MNNKFTYYKLLTTYSTGIFFSVMLVKTSKLPIMKFNIDIKFIKLVYSFDFSSISITSV